MIGMAAFVAGIVINTASVEPVSQAESLLQAKLQIAGSDSTKSIRSDLGKVTLVNFWASWCTPCRKEMPIFETMRQQFRSKGFQVIGVAIDSPSKTAAMLDSMGITYPIYYAENSGMLLMESLGNEEGFLPYSLLIRNDGEVLEQSVGIIDETDIVGWIEAYL